MGTLNALQKVRLGNSRIDGWLASGGRVVLGPKLGAGEGVGAADGAIFFAKSSTLGGRSRSCCARNGCDGASIFGMVEGTGAGGRLIGLELGGGTLNKPFTGSSEPAVCPAGSDAGLKIRSNSARRCN